MAMDLSARIEEWRSQLLDTTKRNRLISLKLGRTGAIKLVYPNADMIWEQIVAQGGSMAFPLKQELIGEPGESSGAEMRGALPSVFDPEIESRSPADRIDLSRCLGSPWLRGNHLLTDMTDKLLKSRLGRVSLIAKTSMTEQGVPTLFLTFGMLRWYESPDSQVEILSPLLLFPAALEREDVESPWELKLQEDEVVPNHSLTQLMSGDFAIRLPDLPDDEEIDSPTSRVPYFEGVRNAVRNQKRWEILDDCSLGIFSFQKIAMWDDLGKNQEHIKAHDLCRAIAGDTSVRIAVPEGLPKARELDASTRPAQTFHILDSDSSQHEAIEAAKRGASLVLDGPPGTGKSQTIANIIAEFLAMGKSVLFVSEKSAALEVVKRRLDTRGLGDFCLECHSHKANKKQVIDELGRCLSLPAETYKNHGDDLDRLVETRESLNAYVRALHEVRQPLGLSAFQAHGRLAAIQVRGITRCPIPDLAKLTPDRLRQMTAPLAALPDCRNVIENHAHHPWRGSRTRGHSLNLGGDIEHHFGRLARGLAEVRDASPLLGHLGFITSAPTVQGWLQGLEMARDSTSYPLVPAEWFREDPRQVASAYIQLDHATRAYRQVRGEIPQFSEEAVLRLDPDVVKEFQSLLDERRTGLLTHDKATFVSLRDHLRLVVGPLRLLAQQVRATNGALDRVLGTLGLTPRPFAARGVGKVQEILGLVGRVAPIRRSWLDPQKRQEIHKVVDRCRGEESQNVQSRMKLLDRMLPGAFDAGHASLASRCLAYRSGWKRLLPGWWSLKRKLAGFYVRGLPETPALMQDMGELDLYHQRIEYARQVERQYGDQLVMQDSVGANWERTMEGLRASEQFDALLRVFPELKEFLIERGRVDQVALSAGLEELAQRYREFREAVKPLSPIPFNGA